MDTFQTELLAKTQINQNTYIYAFKKPDNFLYQAGQYISLELVNKNSMTHDFSLLSAPYETNLKILTRHRKTVFKQNLYQVSTLTKFLIHGPFGNMIIPENKINSLVCLTGGVGISPFFSIIKQAIYEKRKQTIYLFYASKGIKQALFLSCFKEISKKAKNFIFIPTMTKNFYHWQGEKGYFTEIMLRKYIPNLNEPLYFIAGKPELVWSTRKILEKLNVSDRQIVGEEFIGY